MVMEDAETGEQMYVDTHDKKFRERFHSMMVQREDTLKQAFKRAGVDALALSTEEDMVRAIVRFARQRQQLRKVH
jgi:sortase (surface protein transpeptidase)